MSLPDRNLDQMVCSALVQWLQQNTAIVTQIPANMMFAYNRTDVPTASNIWVNVYPLDYDETRSSLYHYGWLQLDFIFTTYWMRENKTQQAINIAGLVLSQTKQSQISLIDFMNQFIGGLQNIGLINKGSYKELYTAQNTTTSKISIQFEYRINWQIYQEWLWSFGCDISSPNIPIYTGIDTIIYNATPTQLALINLDVNSNSVLSIIPGINLAITVPNPSIIGA